ncbi:hypothetical protein Ancab_038949 [Ancistrocladus abbreviatus]
MVKVFCGDKMNVKRRCYREEEDVNMQACVSKHGTNNWSSVPKKAGLKRYGKSCKLRWNNCPTPASKHESFTSQEEELIIKLHAAIGSRWSLIAQQLPGRTDNDVKIYWNTKLRKKLMDMGIDPITHKPFSQILADYGNIGGLSTGLGSICKDAKLGKAEPYAFSTTIMTTSSAPSAIPQHTGLSLQNNNYPLSDSSCVDKHSMDLLTQLQAITLVTEASICNNTELISSPNFITQLLPTSCPSVSSCCMTELMSSQPLCWNDFLSEEAFQPGDPTQDEKETQLGMPSKGCPATTKEVIAMEVKDDVASNSKVESTSLSAGSSFVEAILDQESKMFLDFPGLIMEEPLYC